ncbi:hypothetical protein ACN08Z_03490 [Rothia sp. P7181]|uniref:hypothetical protein n=1 Tax=Rothia sp. P7181 TaxID=3402663 RepID=UPI003ADBC77A
MSQKTVEKLPRNLAIVSFMVAIAVAIMVTGRSGMELQSMAAILKTTFFILIVCGIFSAVVYTFTYFRFHSRMPWTKGHNTHQLF